MEAKKFHTGYVERGEPEYLWNVSTWVIKLGNQGSRWCNSHFIEEGLRIWGDVLMLMPGGLKARFKGRDV